MAGKIFSGTKYYNVSGIIYFVVSVTPTVYLSFVTATHV